MESQINLLPIIRELQTLECRNRLTRGSLRGMNKGTAVYKKNLFDIEVLS